MCRDRRMMIMNVLTDDENCEHLSLRAPFEYCDIARLQDVCHQQ